MRGQPDLLTGRLLRGWENFFLRLRERDQFPDPAPSNRPPRKGGDPVSGCFRFTPDAGGSQSVDEACLSVGDSGTGLTPLFNRPRSPLTTTPQAVANSSLTLFRI